MIWKISSITVTAMIAASLIWAANAWDKNYTEWSEKDIERVMTNSPWAQTVSVAIAGPALGEFGGAPGAGGANLPGGAGGIGSDDAEPGAGGGFGGGRGGGGYGAGNSGMRPVVNLIVRWQSALPVKQALLKYRYGDEAGTSDEAQQFMNREETHYIVGVTGLPGNMAQLAQDTEAIKSSAVLKRKGKEDIVPESVEARNIEQSRTIDLFLLFPKENPITLADKEVEFEARLGRQIQVKRKFKLDKMVYGGKLEL